MRKNIALLIIITIILFAWCDVAYSDDCGDKLVALTFDDGPHPKYTSLILDVLKKHNARATFFIVGERAENLPELVARASKEGHSIGNHAYDHTEFTCQSDRGIISQINRTNKVIESITGESPMLLRPPLGARNKHIDELIKSQNMYNILWNVDPVDWDSKAAQLIHNKVVQNIESGDIIVMHDFYPNTVTATDMILSTLHERGYCFVTVEEILGLFEDADNKAARENVYYSGRPFGKTWSE